MSMFLLCFAAWSAIALGMDRHHEDALGCEGSARQLRALRAGGWVLMLASLWLAAASANAAGAPPTSVAVVAWTVGFMVSAVAVAAAATWHPQRMPWLAGAALAAGLAAAAAGH
ncbi:DUF3325 domain-containing protein [Paracidovorax sp. MALMAid1276]|uniref:DUF3325 domain-containing protein n=1 Tax=Paracidovorax sp. MALMAid1276 TaxID=3411631 RepID=UPI003B9CEEBC